jgi:hypothetical protein
LAELLRRLVETGRIDEFVNLFNHRTVPSRVISPPRVLAASARLLARRGCERRVLLRDVGRLVAEDARRKRLNRQPAYVHATVSPDAGPTEVEGAAAAVAAL